MTNYSPIAQIPYPSLTDAPNMQSAMATMTTALDSMVVPRYSSIATLSAAVPAPAVGQQAFITGSNAFVYWNGTAWVASAMALISQTTLLSAVASVTFSSIPTVFTHLRLFWSGLVVTAVTDTIQTIFNGDTGSNYSHADIGVTGTTGTATPGTTFQTANSFINGARIVGAGSSNAESGGTIDIFNYNSTTQKKAMQYQSFGGGANIYVASGGGRWNSTAAITSFNLKPNSGNNWSIGSQFSLYGIP